MIHSYMLTRKQNATLFSLSPLLIGHFAILTMQGSADVPNLHCLELL